MQFVLLLLCIAEVLLITFYRNIAGAYISPALLLSVSFAIAILFFYSSNKKQQAVAVSNSTKWIRYIPIAIFVILSILIFKKLEFIAAYYPIPIDHLVNSDVIPTVVLFAKRFTTGEYPYTTMDFGTHSLFPTYLPFTWLPFCFAELLHIDYRWISLGCYWAVSVFFMVKALSGKTRLGNIAAQIIIPVFPLLVWYAIVLDEEALIAYTVESLIAAYYLLLALSFHQKKVGLLGVAISLCLLSRYSLLLWLPLGIVIYFFSGRKKGLVLVASIVVAFFILFYALPFLSEDPYLFIKGVNYYTQAALGEWNSAKSGGFWHLGNGLGFARMFYELTPNMDIGQKVALYQKIHFGLLITTSALLSFIYIKRKDKTDVNNYLLFSLKIYLAVFYAFVQVPYQYLFFVPVVVSCSLLLNAYRNRSGVV